MLRRHLVDLRRGLAVDIANGFHVDTPNSATAATPATAASVAASRTPSPLPAAAHASLLAANLAGPADQDAPAEATVSDAAVKRALDCAISTTVSFLRSSLDQHAAKRQRIDKQAIELQRQLAPE
jgi:hypothetical protein